MKLKIMPPALPISLQHLQLSALLLTPMKQTPLLQPITLQRTHLQPPPPLTYSSAIDISATNPSLTISTATNTSLHTINPTPIDHSITGTSLSNPSSTYPYATSLSPANPSLINSSATNLSLFYHHHFYHPFSYLTSCNSLPLSYQPFHTTSKQPFHITS